MASLLLLLRRAVTALAAGSFFRTTEAGDQRVTEAGDIRIT